MNTKLQGNIGLGQAIAYFTSVGDSVSLPLTESQRYDMIVDDGERLYRVEVKTTSQISKYGSYVVQLSTQGGNRTWNGTRKFLSTQDADTLFVYVVGTGDRYVFPMATVEGKASLTLSKDKDMYKV